MKKIREFFQKRFRDKYKAFFYIALICAAIFLSCFVAASGRIGTLMAENHRLTSEKEETERTAQKEAEEMQQQITLFSN